MYTIGRLAQRAKLNVDSIRFYERQGLLFPETKTDSGYRLYNDDALRRITFIKHAQRCGFSLAEIGELLHMHNCENAKRADAYGLAAKKHAEIRETMQALEGMSEALTTLLAERAVEPTESATHYSESPILRALETGATGRSASRQPAPRGWPGTLQQPAVG
jgi:MerR family Zn(II)-responsive transcriptional regulator of zntA